MSNEKQKLKCCGILLHGKGSTEFSIPRSGRFNIWQVGESIALGRSCDDNLAN